MKKKLLKLLLLVVCLIPINIFADSKTYIHWDLDMSIFAHQIRDGKDNMTNLAIMDAGGEIAYCIEPGIVGDNDAYYNTYDRVDKTPLGDIDVKRITLIGFYGYRFNNHNTKEYYMAAQELIWEERGVEDVYWTKDSKTGPKIDIEKEKNEILKLVDEHTLTPKFKHEDSYIVGEKVILEDTRGVLKYYELDKNYDYIKKDGNKLIFDIKEGKNKYELVKTSKKINKYYYNSGFQTIASFGMPYEVRSYYAITGIYGNITINKLDYDSKTNISYNTSSTLENAKYGLFDTSNNLLEEGLTNKEGKLVFTGIKYGDYIIKELESSIGYKLDNNEYKVSITKEDSSIVINSYEKVITGNITLKKYLNDTLYNKLTPEDGIIFDIFYNDELYASYETNKEGIASFSLPYGKYIIKQRNCPLYALKVDDFEVIIDKEGINETFMLLNKKKIEKLPNTGKSNISFIGLLLSVFLGYIYAKKYN